MALPLLWLTMALTPAAAYPKANLLIEAADLKKAEAVILLDVRAQKDYAAGHVPGAVWVDAKAWDRAFNAEPDAAAWGKRLGAAGIDLRKPVVIYGDNDVRDAARMWWILRFWGVPDVRLLNGGWSAWKAADGQSTTVEPERVAKAVTLTAQPERLATKEELLKALKGKPPQLIDARSAAEYGGRVKTAKRNGAIPGAVHLEWDDCLDPKTKRFKTPAELAKQLSERNFDAAKPAVTYCQSGGRAAVVAFTLELMGGQQVKNYYRSWSEWGNAEDTPIEKPVPKKP